MTPPRGCRWEIDDRVSYNGYNGTVVDKFRIGGGHRLVVAFDADGSRVPIACHKLKPPVS